ncbi:hypothetical protein OG948_29040 [Embleya sp. NBC_00888]|uniref:hypothetical protein n=1 Tax=Embleya sp. NBC_00888 TaxID=2975960 RepID=UPI003866D738|nr:hypothetical protein OG948_29040 [Embleya sp. NBC_00888]
MSRRQHSRGRVLAACAAGALAVTAIGACSSDGDDVPSPSSKRLNIEKFRQTVRPIGERGPRCPLPFDVAAATARIHLDGAVTPGDPAAVDVGEGWSDDEAAARDLYSNLTPVQRANGVTATCSYRVGAAELDVATFASRRGHPLVMGLPVIARDADAASPVLGAFADKMATIAPQQVVPVGNGHVAAVRLNVNGPGEAALYVSSETLTPAQIADLAGEFAHQLD